MKTYRLYIGSNNRTGKVEMVKINAVAGKYFDGYTIQDTLGFWKGKPESSCALTVIVQDSLEMQDRIYRLAAELATELEQHAVLVEEYLVSCSIAKPIPGPRQRETEPEPEVEVELEEDEPQPPSTPTPVKKETIH